MRRVTLFFHEQNDFLTMVPFPKVFRSLLYISSDLTEIIAMRLNLFSVFC